MPRNASSALRALRVQLGALRDDRIGRRPEVLVRGHDEAVVTQRLVDADERAAAGEQPEREDGRDHADDDQRYAGAATAPAGLGRRLGRNDLGQAGRLACGVVPTLVEPEGRVPIRHQPGVRDHPRDPAVEPEHEVEDAGRIARREQERDAGEEHEDADEPACKPQPHT